MRKFWDNSSVPASGFDGEVRKLAPVPARLTLGHVRISPATVLAPMAGVTDTVAGDVGQYVALALRLGRDGQWRRRGSERMRRRTRLCSMT